MAGDSLEEYLLDFFFTCLEDNANVNEILQLLDDKLLSISYQTGVENAKILILSRLFSIALPHMTETSWKIARNQFHALMDRFMKAVSSYFYHTPKSKTFVKIQTVFLAVVDIYIKNSQRPRDQLAILEKLIMYIHQWFVKDKLSTQIGCIVLQCLNKLLKKIEGTNTRKTMLSYIKEETVSSIIHHMLTSADIQWQRCVLKMLQIIHNDCPLDETFKKTFSKPFAVIVPELMMLMQHDSYENEMAFLRALHQITNQVFLIPITLNIDGIQLCMGMNDLFLTQSKVCLEVSPSMNIISVVFNMNSLPITQEINQLDSLIFYKNDIKRMSFKNVRNPNGSQIGKALTLRFKQFHSFKRETMTALTKTRRATFVFEFSDRLVMFEKQILPRLSFKHSTNYTTDSATSLTSDVEYVGSSSQFDTAILDIRQSSLIMNDTNDLPATDLPVDSDLPHKELFTYDDTVDTELDGIELNVTLTSNQSVLLSDAENCSQIDNSTLTHSPRNDPKINKNSNFRTDEGELNHLFETAMENFSQVEQLDDSRQSINTIECENKPILNSPALTIKTEKLSIVDSGNELSDEFETAKENSSQIEQQNGTKQSANTNESENKSLARLTVKKKKVSSVESENELNDVCEIEQQNGTKQSANTNEGENKSLAVLTVKEDKLSSAEGEKSSIFLSPSSQSLSFDHESENEGALIDDINEMISAVYQLDDDADDEISSSHSAKNERSQSTASQIVEKDPVNQVGNFKTELKVITDINQVSLDKTNHKIRDNDKIEKSNVSIKPMVTNKKNTRKIKTKKNRKEKKNGKLRKKLTKKNLKLKTAPKNTYTHSQETTGDEDDLKFRETIEQLPQVVSSKSMNSKSNEINSHSDKENVNANAIVEPTQTENLISITRQIKSEMIDEFESNNDWEWELSKSIDLLSQMALKIEHNAVGLLPAEFVILSDDEVGICEVQNSRQIKQEQNDADPVVVIDDEINSEQVEVIGQIKEELPSKTDISDIKPEVSILTPNLELFSSVDDTNAKSPIDNQDHVEIFEVEVVEKLTHERKHTKRHKKRRNFVPRTINEIISISDDDEPSHNAEATRDRTVETIDTTVIKQEMPLKTEMNDIKPDVSISMPNVELFSSADDTNAKSPIVSEDHVEISEIEVVEKSVFTKRKHSVQRTISEIIMISDDDEPSHNEEAARDRTVQTIDTTVIKLEMPLKTEMNDIKPDVSISMPYVELFSSVDDTNGKSRIVSEDHVEISEIEVVEKSVFTKRKHSVQRTISEIIMISDDDEPSHNEEAARDRTVETVDTMVVKIEASQKKSEIFDPECENHDQTESCVNKSQLVPEVDSVEERLTNVSTNIDCSNNIPTNFIRDIGNRLNESGSPTRSNEDIIQPPNQTMDPIRPNRDDFEKAIEEPSHIVQLNMRVEQALSESQTTLNSTGLLIDDQPNSLRSQELSTQLTIPKQTLPPMEHLGVKVLSVITLNAQDIPNNQSNKRVNEKTCEKFPEISHKPKKKLKSKKTVKSDGSKAKSSKKNSGNKKKDSNLCNETYASENQIQIPVCEHESPNKPTRSSGHKSNNDSGKYLINSHVSPMQPNRRNGLNKSPVRSPSSVNQFTLADIHEEKDTHLNKSAVSDSNTTRRLFSHSQLDFGSDEDDDSTSREIFPLTQRVRLEQHHENQLGSRFQNPSKSNDLVTLLPNSVNADDGFDENGNLRSKTVNRSNSLENELENLFPDMNFDECDPVSLKYQKKFGGKAFPDSVALEYLRELTEYEETGAFNPRFLPGQLAKMNVATRRKAQTQTPNRPKRTLKRQKKPTPINPPKRPLPPLNVTLRKVPLRNTKERRQTMENTINEGSNISNNNTNNNPSTPKRKATTSNEKSAKKKRTEMENSTPTPASSGSVIQLVPPFQLNAITPSKRKVLRQNNEDSPSKRKRTNFDEIVPFVDAEKSTRRSLRNRFNAKECGEAGKVIKRSVIANADGYDSDDSDVGECVMHLVTADVVIY